MNIENEHHAGGYSPLDDTMNRDQAIEIWTEMVAMYPQMARGTTEEVEARQRVWGRLLSQANYQMTKNLLEQHYLSNEFAPKPAEVIRIKRRDDPSKTTVKEDLQAVYGNRWEEVYRKEKAHYEQLEKRGIERMRKALNGEVDE